MSERDSSPESGVGDRSGDETQPSIAQDIVVTKYNMAAEIVNAVLQDLVNRCQPGQSVGKLCEYGDTQLLDKTSKVFKKEKEMKKGIAFPTCISVNNCICHYSPLKSDWTQVMADGDMVKIDLGAHLDGFIATAASTLVIGVTKDNKLMGRKADVMLAAHNCLEGAIRMLRPGQHKNAEVTDMIQRIAETYHCKPVENMLSFQLQRNQIGNEEDEDAKVIIQNPSEEQRQKLKKFDFEQFEVYAIDVLISTGEGKGRELDARTTVFKRKETVIYQLKMKASRTFFSEADKKFGVFPFTLRMFEDEKKAKMGVKECETHALMKPFKVYYERDNEFVAQFKVTVLIMPNGLLKITGLPFNDQLYESQYSIEDKGLKLLISSSLKPSKKKGKKGGGAKEGDEAPPTAPAANEDAARSGPPPVEAVH